MKPIVYKVIAVVIVVMTVAFFVLPYAMNAHPGEQPVITAPVNERG